MEPVGIVMGFCIDLLKKRKQKLAMYAKFIPIYEVESFVLFPVTRDYLNLEMFKIFYLL
jgi:hypothetical protein